MKFLDSSKVRHDLTYNDVFLVPGYSGLKSRFDVDLTPPEATGTTIPLIVANMSAIAGKRMAETVARRGGIAVLPQDVPLDVLKQMIGYVKSRDLVYETPLTLGPQNTIAEALNIIYKRAHGAVIIVNNKNEPVGIFQESDGLGFDRFTRLEEVMSSQLVTIAAGLPPKRMFDLLNSKHIDVAPVVENGRLIGLISQKGALRSSLYRPAVDKKNRLMIAAAIGINGDVAAKAENVLKAGADIIVADTAHGHQKKMIDAIKAIRSVSSKVRLAAGNVVTAEAVRDLIEAGADIVKVGVGPGAMCTTRMMTGVGRPQFSAVMECSAAARELGKHVWADGGVRYPRDVALALAAGASSVMFGSWWAGTYESAGDTVRDNDGRLYKENFGMASKRAVQNRTRKENAFSSARKEFFEEGISQNKSYIDQTRPGAEDLIDHIVAGVRSSMAYAGAKNIQEFHEKAVIGIQSAAGFEEGKALHTNWS